MHYCLHSSIKCAIKLGAIAKARCLLWGELNWNSWLLLFKAHGNEWKEIKTRFSIFETIKYTINKEEEEIAIRLNFSKVSNNNNNSNNIIINNNLKQNRFVKALNIIMICFVIDSIILFNGACATDFKHFHEKVFEFFFPLFCQWFIYTVLIFDRNPKSNICM